MREVDGELIVEEVPRQAQLGQADIVEEGVQHEAGRAGLKRVIAQVQLHEGLIEPEGVTQGDELLEGQEAELEVERGQVVVLVRYRLEEVVRRLLH